MKDYLETKKTNIKQFTKQVTLLLSFFVTLADCKVDVEQNNSVTDNKNVITEERAITESITKIEVQEGITVYLTMGLRTC
jgi:hypothetical protein